MALFGIERAKQIGWAFWFVLANPLIPPISPLHLACILTRFVESAAALRLR